MMHDFDDIRLMAMIKEGDMRALGAVYLRHGDTVKTALARFAPEMADADVDEVCQEVFLALNDSAGRYEECFRFKAWLYGIAVRKARMWRRRTWLRRSLLTLHGSASTAVALPSDENPAATYERRREILESLDRLTAKQREVLLLHAVDGFSGEEIAEVLGVSVGVVWSRLHRARRILSECERLPAPERVLEGEL